MYGDYYILETEQSYKNKLDGITLTMVYNLVTLYSENSYQKHRRLLRKIKSKNWFEGALAIVELDRGRFEEPTSVA